MHTNTEKNNKSIFIEPKHLALHSKFMLNIFYMGRILRKEIFNVKRVWNFPNSQRCDEPCEHPEQKCPDSTRVIYNGNVIIDLLN